MPRLPESSRYRLAALCTSAALAACAPVVVPPPPPPPAPVCVQVPAPVLICEPAPKVEPNPADVAARRFFGYQDQIRGLPNGELMRELTRIGEPNGRPQATVEFALVLGQTRNPADTVRAMSLLDPLIKATTPDAAPWQPMARLLFTRFGEQRRAEEQVERQNQQLRDSQRRLDQLNEKLEALKAIEKSLNTRSGASAPAAPKP